MIHELFQFQFMQNAIIAAVLASLICGVMGVFVVIKRLVFISGGIAHASFGGIGIGYFLGLNPLWCILPFSLLSALIIGLISRQKMASEDSIIGVFWALGMSIGVIFIGLTPGYAPDLFSYLFGNILTVPRSDIILMAILCAAVLALLLFFYKEIVAVCFDEESAEVNGVAVTAMYLLLLCLIAVTVVVLVRIVGIVLVIALLTIPATIALRLANDLKRVMAWSVSLGVIFTLLGLALSYVFDLASGATIIMVASAGMLLSFCVKR